MVLLLYAKASIICLINIRIPRKKFIIIHQRQKRCNYDKLFSQAKLVNNKNKHTAILFVGPLPEL